MRVLIADDHPLFRIGLSYALAAQGFDVVGQAEDGAQAVKQSELHQPDVVLLDVKMPRCNGIDACRAIRERVPGVFVALLTTFEEEAVIQAARAAGAQGFFSKETPPAELTKRLTKMLAEPERDWLPDVTLPELSPREMQVLRLLGGGGSNKAIAKEMCISPETVKTYLASVYNKLEVRDRLGAVNRARALGLL